MTDPDTISADYSLRPSELASTLALLVEARQPVVVWGGPGCAKSQIAQQVAAQAGRAYVDVRALLLDPVDLRGIPWRPEGAALIACGNREGDRGVVHRMPAPLASRFVHLEIRVDAVDWCAWGAANGIAPEVLFFVSMRPELLHAFNPQSTEKAFPCPRARERLLLRLRVELVQERRLELHEEQHFRGDSVGSTPDQPVLGIDADLEVDEA